MNKFATVKVTADAAGNVIVPSKKNPEYGHIRVEQERMVLDDSGFSRRKVVSALMPGTISDLKGWGWSKDQMVDGCVYFKESLTPFNPKDPERDYKVAGKTGVICEIDGKPIYRKTFYSKNPDMNDVYILDQEGYILSHTNGEEIRAAYAALKEQEKENADKSESSIGKL